MLKRLLPVFIAAAAISQISFSGGLNSDATGGPASGGQFCGNPACHGGAPGSFDPSLSIEILDGEEAITDYAPGTTYRLRVTIEAGSGTPAGYGFQAVALQADTIVGAGSFSNPGDDVRTRDIGDRSYVTHSTRSSTNTFEADWTAPEAGFGDVEFWVAGNAVNGNGSNSGDNPVRNESAFVLSEGQATQVREIASITSLSVFPNPVFDQPIQLNLTAKQRDRLTLRVLAPDGRIVKEERWEILEGKNNRTLSFQSLPAGLYVIQLLNGKGVTSRQVFKH